ncbi:MAG: DUF2530 domain-containing protein [Actinomycetes bacterium]
MRSTVVTLVIGIVLWVFALIISLAVSARSNAVWICFVGALLGIIGLRYTIRRARREGW